MIKRLRIGIIFLLIFSTPAFLFCQTAPNLGAASSFALFTAVGAFGNTGATIITGDAGTNAGAFTGFPPGTVIGTVHVADGVSAQAATDANTAYSFLSGQTCGPVLGVSMGGGQVLTPNIYCIGAAATLSGSLTLDGLGDPNSVFIIKINGALSAAASSSVILINGASICNVYWQINGQLSLGTNSVFRGTALVNGAINLAAGAKLFGRGLSIAGAISLLNNTVTRATAPVASTVTANGSTSLCPGGTVSLSGNNGGAWSNGALTAAITVSASGNYFVTNTTSCGSITSNTITVTVLPAFTVTVNSATICSGSSATLTAGGANTFSWSPGTGLNTTTGSSVIASPTLTTVYTVTGSIGTCSATRTGTVTVNPLPTATIAAGSPTTFCQGGSVILTASSGTSFLWSTGATTQSISVSTAGNYSVTVTNGNGCSQTSSVTTVAVNPLPTVTANGGVICAGGSVTLTASGANTFTWAPGTGLNTTFGASVIASPTVTTAYTITGTSLAGCSNTTIATVTVVPGLTISVNSPTICAGDSVILIASGASSFSWSPGTGLNTTTGSSVTAGPTLTTVYTVTGTAGTCSATQTGTVTVNPLPTATIAAGGSTTFCQGGSVILTASGGTSFLWSNGATTQSISVSTAGNYSVTVTNGNGCSQTSSVTTVSVNPLPTVTVNNGVICNGGSTTLTASGANTFTWSPGAGLNTTTGSSVIASPSVSTNYTVTGTSLAGCTNTAVATVSVMGSLTLTVNSATICSGSSATLTAGGANSFSWSPGTGLNTTSGSSVIANPTLTTMYTVTGTAGICSASQTGTVTVNPLPTATIAAGGPTAFCQGGSVILTASGGTSFLWSNGATTQTINVSAAGNYSVMVTDGNGCSETSSITTVMVNPLPTVTVNNGAICNGGSATLIAGGADTYSWSPGIGLNTTTGSIVIASPSITTSYTVTGTSLAGCTNTAVATVSVTGNLTLTVNSATICNGNSTTLTANGANSFSWSPGTGLNTTTGFSVIANPTLTTIYTVTGTAGVCTTTTTGTVTVNSPPAATIAAGGPTVFCQGGSVILNASNGTSFLWSNGATTQSISVSTAGNYSVTVTSGNGCSATSSVVTVVVNPLPTASISANGPTSFCQGDFVILTASPGTSYLWSNGATTQSIMVSNAGNFSVTVTNANGCSATSSGLTVMMNLVPTATVAVSGPTTFCQGGSVILTSSPGSSYLWSNNATTQSITVTTNGNYFVTVTSANGCTATSAPVTASVNPAPTVNLGNDTTVCGCIILNAYNPGSSYNWSNGQDYSMINVCTTGTFWVNVSNGICITTDTIRITVHPNPVVNISMITGSVTILNAGNPGSSFLWNTGATTQTISANTTGIYFVTVTNQFGCKGSDTTDVGQVGISTNILTFTPLKIYPNPTLNKNLNMSFDVFDRSTVEIRIVNTLGIAVYEEKLENFYGPYNKSLNFQNFAEGMYYAEVRSGSSRRVIKISLE